MGVKAERKCWSDETDGGSIEEEECRVAAGKIQIRKRLRMTCKAKAIAGGFEILYKTRRLDERAKGRRERREK